MRALSSIRCPAVLVAVLAACGETGPTTSPVVRLAASPSNGAIVSRFPVPQLLGLLDFERNLSAILGIAPEEAAEVCADPDFAPYDLSNVQDVLKPTGANKATITDPEQQVVVWEGIPAPGQRISCTFQNQVPVAVGTIRSTYNDNNIFGAPAPGAIKFQYRGTGTLTNPVTGQEYRAVIRFGGQFLPNGEVRFEEDVIQLTAVGGN